MLPVFMVFFCIKPEIFWLTRVIVASVLGLLFRYVNYSEGAYPKGFPKLGIFLSELLYLSGFVFMASIITPKLYNENILYMLITAVCAICILAGYPRFYKTTGAEKKKKES